MQTSYMQKDSLWILSESPMRSVVYPGFIEPIGISILSIQEVEVTFSDYTSGRFTIVSVEDKVHINIDSNTIIEVEFLSPESMDLTYPKIDLVYSFYKAIKPSFRLDLTTSSIDFMNQKLLNKVWVYGEGEASLSKNDSLKIEYLKCYIFHNFFISYDTSKIKRFKSLTEIYFPKQAGIRKSIPLSSYEAWRLDYISDYLILHLYGMKGNRYFSIVNYDDQHFEMVSKDFEYNFRLLG